MGSIPRLNLLRWVLLGACVLLLGRSAQVQLLQHAHWEAEAEKAQQERVPISARRGSILARDGNPIASSVANWSLAVDPESVRTELPLAQALDSLGLMDAGAFLQRLGDYRARHPHGRFLWLNREIISEVRLAPLLRRFPALIVRREDKRLYPMGRAGGPLVGIMGVDQTPLGGLETEFDERLRGRDGCEIRTSDANSLDFQGFEVSVLEDPVPGCNIETTLHPRLQEIVLARMEAGVARERAARGFCILLRPQTGEILALVQVPCADPERPETWNGPNLRVCPVTDVLEPGSSFKMVAFAAAIEAGLFDPDEPINCMNGSRSMPGGRPITDHDPYGVLKAWEVLAKSSNIGTGLLAERVGPERFYRQERAFGFGLPTGVPLPGEGRGRITEPATWSARSLATMAFGQEVSCSALQMALAYAAIANGGNLMKPLLVRAVRAPDGTVVERWDPEVVRPVLRPAAARQLRELLRRVVTDGTGSKAEIDHYRPAGKTSTAQKFIPEEGTYSTRRYVGSFVGFAPYDDPQVLCLVLLDEPTSSIYGGSVAAPIFREIVSDVLPFLNGEPAAPSVSEPGQWVRNRENDGRREVPSVVGLSTALALRIVRDAGFLARPTGTGDRVAACNPPAGERCLQGSIVTLSLGAETDSAGAPIGSIMPDLHGLGLRDALLRIRSAGGEPRVTGSGWVVLQVPEPGGEISPGQSCLITLGPDSSRALTEFLENERRAAWTVAARDGDPAPER